MQDDSIPMKSRLWDSSWPKLLNQAERQEILSYLEGEFGCPPSLFAPYEFWRTSRVFYLFRSSKDTPKLCDLKIQNLGIPAIRLLGRHRKPTTEFIQIFGQFATKKVLDLDKRLLADLARNGEIPWPKALEQGFYIIKNGRFFWGLALSCQGDRLVSYLSKKMQEAILGQPSSLLKHLT